MIIIRNLGLPSSLNLTRGSTNGYICLTLSKNLKRLRIITSLLSFITLLRLGVAFISIIRYTRLFTSVPTLFSFPVVVVAVAAAVVAVAQQILPPHLSEARGLLL